MVDASEINISNDHVIAIDGPWLPIHDLLLVNLMLKHKGKDVLFIIHSRANRPERIEIPGPRQNTSNNISAKSFMAYDFGNNIDTHSL